MLVWLRDSQIVQGSYLEILFFCFGVVSFKGQRRKEFSFFFFFFLGGGGGGGTNLGKSSLFGREHVKQQVAITKTQRMASYQFGSSGRCFIGFTSYIQLHSFLTQSLLEKGYVCWMRKIHAFQHPIGIHMKCVQVTENFLDGQRKTNLLESQDKGSGHYAN